MDDDVRRELNQIYQGRIRTCGTFTLSTGGTTTTVTDTDSKSGRISSNSVVLVQPNNSNASFAQINWITTAKNSFTVNHTSGGAGRTFNYAVFTGVKSANEP